ncbi:PilN domain-containing protein [Massilia sp. UMI-21]|nr:PilN domain-containing protein [Massilia sp. UMI-21]
MADIDMIPRSYREALRTRRTLVGYGTALALLLAAGGAGAALLRWRVAVETPRLEALRAGAIRADAVRASLASAQQRKDTLTAHVGALAALRGSGEVAALARSLDGALDHRVWFDSLRFSRTRELLQAPSSSPPPPGVFQSHSAAGAPQAWRLGSHVEIAGQALDHAAMTAFLARLAADPALANVRFLHSTAGSADEGGAVSFGVAASMVKKEQHDE